MSTHPKVSVLIPSYNYAHYLDEAIQSVIDQTFTDFELVIVDNHSTDNTEEVVQKYLTDSRIRYYQNPTNLGLGGNWNKCLEYARGKYIKYLCADDKFHPRLLEQYVAVMEENPNVSFVTCFRQQFGTKTNIVEVPFIGMHDGMKTLYHTLNTKGWLGEPSVVMIRRENIKLGKFNPNYTWLIDYDMWIRHLTVGDCYVIPEPLIFIRNHEGQITKMVMRNFINHFEEYQLCKILQKSNPYNIDLSGIDIRQVVKKKAAKCAKAMYKALPSLHKKEERSLFLKAFKIAFKERIIFSTFIDLFTGKSARLEKESYQVIHHEQLLA